MKNQYVGDIGDYGKYSLLRFLSGKGITIGVNWYLTENDISNDGNIRGYLKNESESIYDDAVFSLLKSLSEKSVGSVEASNMIPNAVYYHETIQLHNLKATERKTTRDEWHRNALKALKDAELIFADPDNGSIDEKGTTKKNGEKYVALNELAEYYNSGKDVVYYCHKGRRTEAQWNLKKNELTACCPDVRIIVLTFRRGTQRSYIFGIHPDRYVFYQTIINEFLQTNWGTVKVNSRNIPFYREL